MKSTIAGFHDTDADHDFDGLDARQRTHLDENDTSAIREGVDESLTTLRGLIDELVDSGTIAFDGQVVAAYGNLMQYCAISLEMIARTPL